MVIVRKGGEDENKRRWGGHRKKERNMVGKIIT